MPLRHGQFVEVTLQKSSGKDDDISTGFLLDRRRLLGDVSRSPGWALWPCPSEGSFPEQVLFDAWSLPYMVWERPFSPLTYYQARQQARQEEGRTWLLLGLVKADLSPGRITVLSPGYSHKVTHRTHHRRGKRHKMRLQEVDYGSFDSTDYYRPQEGVERD